MRAFVSFLLLAFAGLLIAWFSAEPARAQLATFTIAETDYDTKTITVQAFVAIGLCTPTGIWEFVWGDGEKTDIGHSIIAGYSHTYDSYGTYTLTLNYECTQSGKGSFAVQFVLSEPTPVPTATPVLTVSISTFSHFNDRLWIITDAPHAKSLNCKFSGALSGPVSCYHGTVTSYLFPGCGTVTLTANATRGKDKASGTAEITVPCGEPDPTPTPLPSGSASVEVASQNDTDRSVTASVSLDQCTGSGTWSIGWGDGESSDVTDPWAGQVSHVYADWGIYTITLTYTCQGGNESSATTSVGFPHPTPTPTLTPSPVPAQSDSGAGHAVATPGHPCLPAGATVKSNSPWLSHCEVDASGVGVKWIVEAGFIEAIDVWGPQGVQAEVCFAGHGALLLLDAAYSPRRPVWMNSYLSDGKTCAQLDRAGTLVLMPGSPNTIRVTPTATLARLHDPYLIADSLDLMKSLENCMVTSLVLLNFRERPAGTVLDYFGGTGAALARTPNWFKVQHLGMEGWISAHYVTTEGDCG